MGETLAVAIGGALGSVLRYWVGVWALPISRSLPWGTIIINIAGSFAISFFGTLTTTSGRWPMPDAARLFFMVGICGGFTTFSSFSLQTLDLLRGGAWGRAAVNVVASVMLCMISVTAGFAAGSYLSGGSQQIAQAAIEEEVG